MKTVGRWSNPKNKTIFPFRSGITAAVIIIRTRILGTTKTTINKIVRTTIGATIGTKTDTTIRSILDNMKLGSGNYNILLFREGKSTSNHKSNCRVDLVPLRTISTGMGGQSGRASSDFEKVKASTEAKDMIIARAAWCMAESKKKYEFFKHFRNP